MSGGTSLHLGPPGITGELTALVYCSDEKARFVDILAINNDDYEYQKERAYSQQRQCGMILLLVFCVSVFLEVTACQMMGKYPEVPEATACQSPRNARTDVEAHSYPERVAET